MMDQSNATMARGVLRIPDFHSMPKELKVQRLSHDGRQATVEVRRAFLALNSKPRHENRVGLDLHLKESDRKELSRHLTSSAPPAGFRVKDRSQRNHVVLCAINPKRMSRRTSEEMARQRVKHYISKQIYKIPTSQRPEFSIKLQLDASSVLPYPKGTLPTPNCHFNYVAPKKFLEDNYEQHLGKSTTRNSEMASRHLSASEMKRNKIIEKLIDISSNNALENNMPNRGESTHSFVQVQQPIETEIRINSAKQTPISQSLPQIQNAKQNNADSVTENCATNQSPSPVSRSKTVAFSLTDTEIVANNNYCSKTFLKKHSKSILANQNHNKKPNNNSTKGQNTKGRLTTADIASAHGRYHFIHPKWPSEFVNWARYAHPVTAERYQHSLI